MGGIAQQAQRPIYIYNKADKLVTIVGRDLKGAPMYVEHTINTDGSGHWQIPGDNTKVAVSGTKNTNCLYDACAAQMAPGELTGEDLRQQTVQVLRENPIVTKDLVHTAEQLSWRNRDVLLAGGGMLSTTVEIAQSFEKWLDNNPLLKKAVANIGGIAGGALWLRTMFAKGGPLAIASVLAVDQAYQLMLDNIDFSTAQQRLSTYLQGKDQDLTQEQADYLAKKSIKTVQEVGRFAFHKVAHGVYKGVEKRLNKNKVQVNEKVVQTEENINATHLGIKNNLAISEGAINKFREHAFSKGRHKDLDLPIDTIITKGTELVQHNLTKLSSGDNTIHVTINGIQKTIMANVKDNVVRSINMYSGISNRVTDGPVIKLNNVKW